MVLCPARSPAHTPLPFPKLGGCVPSGYCTITIVPTKSTTPTHSPTQPHCLQPTPLHTMSSFFSRFFGPRRYSGQWNENGGSTSANPTSVAPPPSTTTAAAAPFDYMPLPKERIASLKGAFSFDKWVGVSVVQWFFVSIACHIAQSRAAHSHQCPSSHVRTTTMQVLFYCLVGTLLFLSVAQALLVGSAGIAVMQLILAPIFFLLLTLMARVICELVISALMVRVVGAPCLWSSFMRHLGS